MPNRILKESICTSENIDQLTSFVETVFYRLIVNCDDYGRMDARPKLLAAKLFPLKDIRSKQIEDALRELTSAELVTTYEVDGKPFLQMNTWDRHQNIRAKQSKYPSPDEACKHLYADDIKCMQMNTDDSKCSRNPIQSNPNPNPNPNIPPISPLGGKGGGFVKPSVEEVKAYCQERGNSVDPEAFVAFYESNGWKVGKNPMKNWKSAVITWEKSRKEGNRGRSSENKPVYEPSRVYHSPDAELPEGWHYDN